MKVKKKDNAHVTDSVIKTKEGIFVYWEAIIHA